ncbi:MAG TPA: hypothetical protein VM580_16160 [Labilithrix sp.]|nr:hypothetical protein [Labilithrix sp.]
MSTRAPFRTCVLAATVLGTLAAACGESKSSDAEATNADGKTGTAPLYAMMIQIYGTEDRTVYVSLSHTLDITSTNIEGAREFPGVANFAAVNGRILVSSGIEAKITEFDISNDLEWIEGRSVSFSNYPLFDNANFYYQFIVDSNNALLPYDGTKRIHWDPSEMVIKGNLEDTTLTPSEPNLLLDPGGNRNGVKYDGSVLQAFFYHDSDWYTYGTKSHVIAYNPQTFTEKSVVDIPCPGLSIATRDEQGNTYFSNWDLPSASLKGVAPAPCIAKFGPNNELISTIDPRSWTGGRFVNNFRYVGGKKAFANVLHHEALGVSSTTELSDEALSTLGADGPHWKLWLLDIDAGTGTQVEGIAMQIAGGAQMATLDGRTFLFVPYQKWGRTKAYELTSDGKAIARFDTAGDVFKWVRVR